MVELTLLSPNSSLFTRGGGSSLVKNYANLRSKVIRRNSTPVVDTIVFKEVPRRQASPDLNLSPSEIYDVSL